MILTEMIITDIFSSMTNCELLIEFIKQLPQYILAAGLIVAAFTYRSTRKGNYLQTIESCSKEYRDYMRRIQKGEGEGKGTEEDILKRDILGLFHKQLFYIQNNYVPKEIKIEWILAMCSMLKNGANCTENKNSRPKNSIEFSEDDINNDSFTRVNEFKKAIKPLECKSCLDIKKMDAKSLKKYFSCWERICLKCCRKGIFTI